MPVALEQRQLHKVWSFDLPWAPASNLLDGQESQSVPQLQPAQNKPLKKKKILGGCQKPQNAGAVGVDEGAMADRSVAPRAAFTCCLLAHLAQMLVFLGMSAFRKKHGSDRRALRHPNDLASRFGSIRVVRSSNRKMRLECWKSCL